MTGTELRAERLALGLTQAKLATALGRARYTVSRWETGRHRIRDGTTLRLALAGLRLRTIQPHQSDSTPDK